MSPETFYRRSRRRLEVVAADKAGISIFECRRQSLTVKINASFGFTYTSRGLICIFSLRTSSSEPLCFHKDGDVIGSRIDRQIVITVISDDRSVCGNTLQIGQFYIGCFTFTIVIKDHIT